MTKALAIDQKTTLSSSKETRPLWADGLWFKSACSSCVKAVEMERLKHYIINKDVRLRTVCCS